MANASESRWRFSLHEARESDLPMKLEPLGYFRNINSIMEASGGAVSKTMANTLDLKRKRAMEIGMGPFKGLLQTGFMMWMSGSSVHIFSIMVTGMVIMNTLKSLFSLEQAFSSVNDGTIDLIQAKLAFVAGSLLNLAMAMYKCGTMGLLPTTSADWTWLLPIKKAVEVSQVAIQAAASTG